MIPGAMFASVARPIAGGAAWGNTYSTLYAGTVTSDAGRTTFGQPSAWSKTLNSQELTMTMWFKRNGRDGILFASRSDSNAYWHCSISSGAIACYFGGNFASGGSVSDATWYPLTMTVRNESGTYTGRAYLGSSSTSILNTTGGTTALAMDFFLNIRRGSNNTNFSIGSWGTSNIDELAIWNVGFTGSDHVEWYNSGTPMDAEDHSQAANLLSYYRCGDAPSDSSTVLEDIIGSDNGTHENTSNVSYDADVA